MVHSIVSASLVRQSTSAPREMLRNEIHEREFIWCTIVLTPPCERPDGVALSFKFGSKRQGTSTIKIVKERSKTMLQSSMCE